MYAYTDILTELCRQPGPSGFEDAIRQTLLRYLRPLTDSWRIDAMGNLTAVRRATTPDAPTVLLCAHMDEVGFVVTGQEGAYLRIAPLGSVDARLLPASDLCLLTQPPIFGVVDVMPPHALKAEEMEQAIPFDRLYLDTGLSTVELAERVPAGTPAVYVTAPHTVGDTDFVARALDNRACCAVILQTLDALRGEPLPFHIACLFTAQEELGRRGIVPGAYAARPQCAIVLDATFAPQPGVPAHKTFAHMTVGVGPHLHRSLTTALLDLATQLDLPVEREVLPGDTGTDATPLQISRGGVPTALLSLPVRYMHAPAESMHLADAHHMISLLTAFLRQYDSYRTLLERGGDVA